MPRSSAEWALTFKQAKSLRQPIKPLYQSYLASEVWKSRRAWIIGLAKGRCEVCIVGKASEVHHLTYDRAGDERREDLQAICNKCHREAHPDKWSDSQFVKPGGYEARKEAYRRKNIEYKLRRKAIDQAGYAAALGSQEKTLSLVAEVARSMVRFDSSGFHCSDEDLAMRVVDHPQYLVHALYPAIEDEP